MIEHQNQLLGKCAFPNGQVAMQTANDGAGIQIHEDDDVEDFNQEGENDEIEGDDPAKTLAPVVA